MVYFRYGFRKWTLQFLADNNYFVLFQLAGSRSDVKLQLKVNGFNLNQCNNVYKRLSHSLTTKHLCAGGEEGRDSCSGDSGGPLMGEDFSNSLSPHSYLAGIVSFGPQICGTPGFPGVYTVISNIRNLFLMKTINFLRFFVVVFQRIDQYIDWIVGHMEKNL